MPSKKTNSKTKPVQAAAAPAPPAPEPAPVVEAAAPESAEQTWADKGADFAAKLQQVSALLTSLRAEFRTLDKTWTREFKAAQKAGAKRRRKSGNRSPSGFVKPTLISQELASFLDKPSGTEMARTEVTREINKYIRAHNLQDKNNGRKINPDAKLAKLLKLKKEDELTYFNLQRYMSPHFAKAGTKITTSA
jgi:upstream activation factor subunit UAF30